MSDIHQEWKEIRQKNGDFINHIDGELAKIEKEKVELKRREEKQDLLDAGAFAMQFVAPPPFNCCQNDHDILKSLNKAQADQIEQLEDKILAYKEQKQIDLAVAKEVDEKLAKVTADYRALWVENKDLKRQLAGAKAQCENTVENRQKISELSQEVVSLRERLASANEELTGFISMYDKAADEAHQANVAKDRMGYSNRCMQSKIAKQANEIKRLAHENVGLVIDMKHYRNEIEKLKQGHWDEMERLQNANAKLEYDNFQLKQALGTSARDADANFDRGYRKGMDELWAAIRKVQDERPSVLTDIYGQGCMCDCVSNLSAQDFAKKTMEWEDKQAKDIQIGDEVEIFDEFDHDLSDIGIVIVIDKDNPCFAVIGPNFEGCFDETDIENGNVRKTGRHFDSIPLDYFK